MGETHEQGMSGAKELHFIYRQSDAAKFLDQKRDIITASNCQETIPKAEASVRYLLEWPE